MLDAIASHSTNPKDLQIGHNFINILSVNVGYKGKYWISSKVFICRAIYKKYLNVKK